MDLGIQFIMMYGLGILPPLCLALILFISIRPPAYARIILYILIFMLARDGLASVSQLRFGSEGGFWFRLGPDPFILLWIALGALLFFLCIYLFDRENRGSFRFFSNDRAMGLFIGVLSALLILLPFFILYRDLPLSDRGGELQPLQLVPLFFAVVLGCFLEEALFRGGLMAMLKDYLSPFHAGIGSGIVFAFSRSFLVLGSGLAAVPLLLYSLYLGLVTGIVGSRYGVVPAAIAHGLASFFLSSALF